MPRVDKEFKEKVFNIVAQIPVGRVMTYGQIASLAGAAWAAWEVGQIAHTGDVSLPWQRVVNKSGGLAKGYPGGPEIQKRLLESEGIQFTDNENVEVDRLIWWPNEK
jgi:methylated-DNA-protein-cysteine methyltransferase-like protein